jgi:hypothetical protein
LSEVNFHPKRQGVLLLLSLFFMAVALPCQAEELKPFVKIDSLTYSAPVAITTAIFDEWEGEYRRGERQWTWNWFETGLLWRQFGLSYVRRYDYDIRSSEDTSELLGLTKNKEDLPLGRVFNLELEAHVFHAQGIRLHYSNSFMGGRIKTSLGASYLQSDYLIAGTLQGQATIIADKDYDYQGSVHYQYTEDMLFDRQVEDVKGQGFSFDFNALIQISPSWSASLQITDLFGRIYWDDLPYTDAFVNSDRKTYDEDNYVHIDPALQGIESNHQLYTQKLSPRWAINTEYTYSRYIALLEGHMQYDFFLWAVGGGIKTQYGLVSLKYWPINAAVGVGYKYNDIEFSLTTDSLDPDEMKTLQLRLVCSF